MLCMMLYVLFNGALQLECVFQGNCSSSIDKICSSACSESLGVFACLEYFIVLFFVPTLVFGDPY